MTNDISGDLAFLYVWKPDLERVKEIFWSVGEDTRVRCGCGTRLLVPNDWVTVVTCPTCGQRFRATTAKGARQLGEGGTA